MRLASLLACLLFLRLAALAGGTVGFNVNWYPTPQSPFVDEGFPVTSGVVLADFNRDGIPDVAYSMPCDTIG
jgi:hypothetical protein